MRTISLILASLLVWCGHAAAEPVVVGYTAVSSLMLPYWIGKEAGFYHQEGLDERLVYIPSSSTMAQAMLAGNVAVSSVNSQVVVETALQGGNLVAIGSVINVAAFYIMAPPEIKSVQDLKGKPVGVTRFGASTDFGIRQLLKKNGLEPVKDVPILQIGGMPELAAALSKRTIYAAAMSYPMGYVAEQAGVRVLANLAKEDIPFMHVGIVTTRPFLRERREQVKAFLRAYGRSVHFMHTRKEDAKKVLSRYARIDDPGMLEGSMKYAYDFVEKIPTVKGPAFQNTLDEVGKRNPKAAQAKPEQFYDNSLVQELVNEGFFKELWK